MWNKIIGTKVGEEFKEWLRDSYYIGYENEMFGLFDEDMDHIEKAERIINNIAIQWLDSKGMHIYVNPCIEKEPEFMCRIYDSNKDVIKIIKVTKTRQEAIQVGVRKAFQLLEGGE